MMRRITPISSPWSNAPTPSQSTNSSMLMSRRIFSPSPERPELAPAAARVQAQVLTPTTPLQTPPTTPQPTPPPTAPTLTPTYNISISSASTLPPHDLTQCFDLISLTSADAYRDSSVGWSPTKKRREMKLPDMKYLVVRRVQTQDRADGDAGSDRATTEKEKQKGGEGEKEKKEGGRKEEEEEEEEEGDILGFLSFMITYEDGLEVIYCYEVHVTPSMRGQGIGRRLLASMMEIGRRIGMEKAMLTVFKANVSAQRLYEALGLVTDESSPRPRRLRNGMVKEADYRIMSVRLDGGPYV
ncbi:acyl-CoA N-acyltransferase [Aspergillus heteromorphus CBS 117.55]|uniref:N-alpha-acetyltransferase 40 n=1 Tax=Aspergillus heteromorphus CBS 117.55 TaxID=1448321 RepID=A0A317WP76_9EURO|nr:acyl-CoA N-acyltransferase [Aspergillus heteromorphus CBS 117.55]PWY86080.1 acyl-CoA N-acyltransferase [Aspergillus heteromorphus CBS 117.55]